MSGIYSSTYFVGGAFTFFPYHVQDSSLSLFFPFFPVFERSKGFDTLQMELCLHHLSLLHRQYYTRNILAITTVEHRKFNLKITIFNPLILLDDKSVIVKITRIIQEKGQFVVFVPGGYHGRFNCGYIIASATRFADFS